MAPRQKHRKGRPGRNRRRRRLAKQLKDGTEIALEDAYYIAEQSSLDPRDAEDALRLLQQNFGHRPHAAKIPVFRHDTAEAKATNTVIANNSVVLIAFGRVHVYPVRVWKRYRDHYATLLRKEYGFLRGRVRDSKQISQELDGVVQSLSEAVADFASWLTSGPQPPENTTPEQYDALSDRLERIRKAVDGETAEWWDLYEVGFQFHAVREEVRALDRQFLAYMKHCRGGAEKTQKGLELVEFAAFKVIDLIATAKGYFNPAEELALKVASAMLHATARGVGEHTSGGGRKQVWVAFLRQLGNDLPGAISGFVSRKIIPAGSKPSVVRRFIDALVTGIIEVLILVILHALEGKAFSGKELDTLQQQCLDKFIDVVISKALDALLDKIFAGDAKSKVREAIEEALKEAVKSTVSEHAAVYRKSRDEERDFTEVWLEEMPMMIARIVISSSIAAFGPVTQEKARGEHEDRIVAAIEIDVVEVDTQVAKGTVVSKSAGAKNEKTTAAAIRKATEERESAKPPPLPSFKPNVGKLVRPPKGQNRRRAGARKPKKVPPKPLPPPPKDKKQIPSLAELVKMEEELAAAAQ